MAELWAPLLDELVHMQNTLDMLDMWAGIVANTGPGK